MFITNNESGNPYLAESRIDVPTASIGICKHYTYFDSDSSIDNT